MKGRVCLVLTTVPSRAAGRRIARRLVSLRLAACVNAVPIAASTYRWKGRVREEPEVLLLVKTRASLRRRVFREILALRPYALPELLALPVVDGEPRYLGWVLAESQGRPRKGR